MIGSLFAAHLARVADVAALTRRHEHAAALREHGLRVTGRAGFSAQLQYAVYGFGLACGLLFAYLLYRQVVPRP